MDHDRLFKQLLQTFFQEFLALFVPDVLKYVEPGSIEFLDKEIFTDLAGGDRHEVDLLAKCRYRGREACLLILAEVQDRAQPDFAERVFFYVSRLMQHHRLPVYPIALLTYRSPQRAEPDVYKVEFPDLDMLSFRFRTIQLNRLNWRDFVANPNPVAAALMSKMNFSERCTHFLKVTPAEPQNVLRNLDHQLSLAGGQVHRELLDQHPQKAPEFLAHRAVQTIFEPRQCRNDSLCDRRRILANGLDGDQRQIADDLVFASLKTSDQVLQLDEFRRTCRHVDIPQAVLHLLQLLVQTVTIMIHRFLCKNLLDVLGDKRRHVGTPLEHMLHDLKNDTLNRLGGKISPSKRTPVTKTSAVSEVVVPHLRRAQHTTGKISVEVRFTHDAPQEVTGGGISVATCILEVSRLLPLFGALPANMEVVEEPVHRQLRLLANGHVDQKLVHLRLFAAQHLRAGTVKFRQRFEALILQSLLMHVVSSNRAFRRTLVEQTGGSLQEVIPAEIQRVEEHAANRGFAPNRCHQRNHTATGQIEGNLTVAPTPDVTKFECHADRIDGLLVAGDEDWEKQAMTPLFLSKREQELSNLFSIRITLNDLMGEKPTAAKMKEFVESREGRLALAKLIRKAKADRVGTVMADLTICGAIPPYNAVLGGKLVAMLMASPEVSDEYRRRYRRVPSIIASSMAGRAIIRPSDLVFISTTSLYGRRPNQYDRLVIPANKVVQVAAGELRYNYLGKTRGFGTFQFGEDATNAMSLVLSQTTDGQRVNYVFGEGVNPRLRMLRDALDELGFSSNMLLDHGAPRLVYGVPLISNLTDYLLGIDKTPHYLIPKRGGEATAAIGEWWYERWSKSRVQKDGVLEEIEKQTLVHPIQHAAKVKLPPELVEEPLLFED